MSGDCDRSGSADGAKSRRRRSTHSVEGDGVYTGSGGEKSATQHVSTWTSTSNERPSSSLERSISPARLTAQRRNSDETTPAMEKPSESLLDTRAAAIMAGAEVADTPIVGLPNGVESSKSRAPPLNEASLPRKSSRRHRGLSLRSSLFTRNMVQQVKSEPTIMETEMQPIGHSRRLSGASSTGKKMFQTTIIVSPVSDLGTSKWSASSRPTSLEEPSTVSELPTYHQWAQQEARGCLPIKRVKGVYSRLRKYVLRVWSLVVNRNEGRSGTG